MKILFLCNKSPYPPKEGGPIAMNANIEGLLNAGHQVKVLALNTNKYFIEKKQIPEEYQEKTNIEFIYKDLSLKPFDAVLNLFSKKSYHVERFISKEFEKKITEILGRDEYDIVQLEMLYMTPYLHVIRKNSKAKIILRAHNIEHLIWDRITYTAKNPLKKLYLGYLTRKLKNYELSCLNHFNGIATISKKDADYFKSNGCRVPVTDIPFGLDVSNYKIEKTGYEFPSLFHLGSMNWMPNEEGIKWFLDNAWSLIHRKFPNLKFYLAGRMMPEWLQNLDLPNVEVLGEVPDAGEFINSKAVMIVPLFSGSGIRIKIIEGMALSKTIISTDIGAEGIDFTDGKNILIANTPEEFLKAVEKCNGSKQFCEEVGNNARKLIENKHNLDSITKKLEGFYKTILEN
ncbi:MAG: glycosyltransferase [Bacteroidetes bacterium]|nr:glycosyltransferase [Bacteroidota bacterium]MBL7104508.1 glycosyltransferase [Bacteroidales bacterium]